MFETPRYDKFTLALGILIVALLVLLVVILLLMVWPSNAEAGNCLYRGATRVCAYANRFVGGDFWEFRHQKEQAGLNRYKTVATVYIRTPVFGCYENMSVGRRVRARVCPTYVQWR